jgi:hypothetical protein
MRVRCSRGLRVSTFHGPMFVRSTDLLALPQVSYYVVKSHCADLNGLPRMCSSSLSASCSCRVRSMPVTSMCMADLQTWTMLSSLYMLKSVLQLLLCLMGVRQWCRTRGECRQQPGVH